MILIDTNVLLRSVEPNSRHHDAARLSLDKLLRQGKELAVVPQVFYEFWVACTRPIAQNGLGFDNASAGRELDTFESTFHFRNDAATIISEWRRLLTLYDVRGKSAHDARLVAAMLVHEIDTILTFNKSDFARYPSITVMTPDEVVSQPSP